MTRFLPALVLAFFLLATPAAAETLYTSATGTGTACTEAVPCSPAALFDVTDAPFVPARTPNPGDIVVVAPDEYDFSGRYFFVSTPNLTIRGPSVTRTPTTHVPYLNFGAPGAGFAASFGMLIDASNTTIKNITIDGNRPNALVAVNGDPAITGTTLDQVKIMNASNSPATTFLGNDATITNSVFRYDGTSPFGRALEATGTVTGSLAYSLNGQAISLKGNLHPGSPGCSLDVRNTLAWGGGRNLDLDDNGSAPGDCNGVTLSFQNSWIPDPAVPTPALGGGIASSGPLALIILGAGNLPDTPAVFNPLDPASTYLSNYNLPVGSPAINAGCTAGCGTNDFYNRPRPIGSANDIGPWEATLAPSASSGSVSEITTSTATLSARLNPEGGETTYNFLIRRPGSSDWEAVYGAVISEGSNAARVVSAEANMLQPDTAYEVRLTATNSAGETNLDGISFRTLPEPAPTMSVSEVRSQTTKKSVFITSRVTVSGAGTIFQRATGRQKTWCRTSRSASVGTYLLRCNLGKKGRKAIRKKNLVIALRTSFSSSGDLVSSTNRITIKRKR